MSKAYTFTPHGVCSRKIDVVMEDDGTIGKVSFMGGCSGNLQGISRLVSGHQPAEIIAMLEHIPCGGKATSCPDQLAQALKTILAEKR